MKSLLLAATTSTLLAHTSPTRPKTVPKYYKCNETTGFCEQQPLTKPQVLDPLSGLLAPPEGTSQEECLLTCPGTIWPAPTKIVHMGIGSTSEFCGVEFVGSGDSGDTSMYEGVAFENFLESVGLGGSEGIGSEGMCAGREPLVVIMKSTNPVARSTDSLTLETDESYTLEINLNPHGNVVATITSASFYGGRHGLETLSQLIATDRDKYSDKYGVCTIANDVEIKDHPAFPYRGVMLDTSRNYLSMSSIKSVIRGMGYNKLNRLHLHFTDTASFPLQVDTEPNLFYYGAYSSDMYYDKARIKELTEFAHGYGVSIIPEVDVPSHVNMGWNWGQLEGVGDLAICTNDWTATSLEPPAGHLNIANPVVYPILQNIYEFLGHDFGYPDIFHIGGDEVVVGSDETCAACWNSTEYGADILTLLETMGLSRNNQESFYALWHGFTHRIVDMISHVYKTAFSSTGEHHYTSPMNIIWGGNVEPIVGPSPVTYNMVARPDVVQELPPSAYIMEVWDDSADSIAPDLMQKGYQIIAANYDYVYLDCGQPGFTNPGGYWCGPDHEWSHIYQYMHDLQSKWDLTSEGSAKNGVGKIIGSEVLLWGEENGDSTVISKIFPRAAAIAEALWSNPQSQGSDDNLWYQADPRMQLWRNTLVRRGLAASEMQPLWCAQRGPYSCTIDQGIPQ